jgi:hypothetical protein
MARMYGAITFFILLCFRFGIHADSTAARSMIVDALKDSIDIYVFSDGFHSCIVIPDLPDTASSRFLKYEYGETAWYLENRQQWYRVFPVLLIRTEGTVKETRHVDLNETAERAEQKFTFKIPYPQYLKIREYIESWIDRDRVLSRSGNVSYFKSRRPYTVFNSCHTYILKVLKKGGIPVKLIFGLWNSLTVSHLKRVHSKQNRKNIE